MVHELLDFAKPSPLDKKNTDVHRLINDTLRFLNNDLVKHHIKVNKSFESKNTLRLNIDPRQFRQALLNIFLNAIDSMPNGGNLTVSSRIQGLGARGQKQKKSIKSYPLEPETQILEITIRDTGGGIPKEDLKHLFDPFFTKKDGGTGLGLSLTHGIIEQHGGKIHVRSEIGKGSEFVIELSFS